MSPFSATQPPEHATHGMPHWVHRLPHFEQYFANLVEFRRLVEKMIRAALAARSAVVVRGEVGDDDDRLRPRHAGGPHQLQQAKAAAAAQLDVEDQHSWLQC